MAKDKENVICLKGVASYPYLMTPNKDGKYEITLMVDKKDEKTKREIDLAVKKAEDKGMQEVWKGVRPNGNLSPLKDGDGTRDNGNPYGDECKNKWLLRASSKFAPTVLKPDKTKMEDPAEMYGGCIVLVSVEFFPYYSNGRKGISCQLRNVWKLKDGEKLGRSSAEDDFAGINLSDILGDDDDILG